jgi:hypothetical protein
VNVANVMNNSLLLSNIFRHLSLRDLIRLGRVNRLFLRLSRRQEAERKGITHLFATHDLTSGVDGADDGFRGTWSQVSEQLNCRPDICLFFYGLNLRQAQVKNARNWDSIRLTLPPDCVGLSVLNDTGLVGTVDRQHVQEVNVCEQSRNALSYLFIPTHKCSYIVEPFSSRQQLANLTKDRPTDHSRQIKCVLLFKRSQQSTPILSQLLTQTSVGFALGGVISLGLTAGKSIRNQFRADDCPIAGLIFSGEGVRAASIVIETENELQVAKDLQRLKDSLDFDVYDKACETVAFMFACVDRLHLFDKPAIESQAFQRCFPGIRLIGMYGYGETGCNFLPTQPIKLKPKHALKVDFVCSTVFVVLQLSMRK